MSRRRVLAEVHAPDLPDDLAAAALPDDAALDDGTQVTLASLTGVDLRGLRSADVGFEEVRLTGVDLSGGDLERLRLRDAVLADVDLANLHARRSAWQRVSVTASRATGMTFDGTMRDVTFTDCRLDLAAVRFCALTRVRFVGCSMTGADLTGARCESVGFTGCDLSGAEFSDASFTASQLRDCELDALRGLEGLRGLAISLPDAVQLTTAFAAALGIEILDGE